MTDNVPIKQFLDEEGRITQLPRKQSPRMAVLRYLAGKFDADCEYTERQVNMLCGQWSTVGDYFLLRRELVDSKLMCRKPDGSIYWRAPEEDTASEAATNACDK